MIHVIIIGGGHMAIPFTKDLDVHTAVVVKDNFQEVVDIYEQDVAERKSILGSKTSLKAIQYEMVPVVKEYFVDNPRRKQKRRRARKY